MTRPLLEVNNLSMQFGGLIALNGVKLRVGKQQIVSIIGPNGAGKTTVFNCISGFYTPTHGHIIFDGHPIQGLKGHKIARQGMVRTFQHVRLFKEMTVIENLLVAQHQQLSTNFLAGFFQTPGYRQAEQRAMEQTAFWLEQVDLVHVANRPAGNLAYGQQRRLEIARCMVSRPKLLMLDEPAAGLNPKETQALDQLISRLRDEFKISVLLIEHDMSLVMGISDQIEVLDQGCPLASGNADEIRRNPAVIKAYLGES